MQRTELSVEQANAIQAEWMALDVDDTLEDKQAVYDQMAMLPSDYISVHSSGSTGQVMVSGQPVTATVEICACIEIAQARGIQTRLRWIGSGEWREYAS